MPNIRYDLTLAACACVIGVAAGSAAADGGSEQLSGDVFPHGQLVSTIKQTQLEVGLDLKWNNILNDVPDGPPAGGKVPYREDQLRLYGRVPVDGEGATAARIDRFTQAFSAGVRGAHAWDSADGTRQQRVSLALEYGLGRYEYAPNGDEAARQDPVEHSFDLLAEYRLAQFGNGSGHGVVPQVRLKYSRDWQASDKVAVVVPAMGAMPAIARDLVIEPPKVSPALEVRLAVPFTSGSELGFAPSVTYTAHGTDTGWAPGGKVQRLRFEAFAYWFPVGTRGRLGISPFLDIRTRGVDDLRRVEYGGLIDLRIGSNLLEY